MYIQTAFNSKKASGGRIMDSRKIKHPCAIVEWDRLVIIAVLALYHYKDRLVCPN
jgi:hypothetical protein